MLNMSTVIVPANPLKVAHDWSDSIFQIFENRGKLISSNEVVMGIVFLTHPSVSQSVHQSQLLLNRCMEFCKTL